MISSGSSQSGKSRPKKICIAISGANGALGQALVKQFHEEGVSIVGLTTNMNTKLFDARNRLIPVKWVLWKCGEERKLTSLLEEIDLLIINHGINDYENSSVEAINTFININAISPLRLLNLMIKCSNHNREVWINTSEAEIQPAFSPLYEISKRLLGQLTTFHNYTVSSSQSLRIRKLILGPFKSTLNPIGLMTPEFVARQIIYQARMGAGLIIVTPNPLTYILMPILEFVRYLYWRSLIKKHVLKNHDQSRFRSHQM